ncbi:Ubiquitin carboxyl-terminal hydrolase-related protein [Thalictrum thalictroides]|uniref:Ubiquitin carboxyl-terminal hydrolase-related protein n=1 Tax=Thalictrum thalictroides TaxID=46969 RepID=A0A7J6V973_THATH|nr:Ubiquitin carboxyl-terminal hydrolase-related protein [Thalictrum thalictroides]
MWKKKNKKVHPYNASETTNPSTNNESGIDSSILEECKRADRVFHSGNHTKALKIIEEACRRNKNSALLHRVHGDICMMALSDNYDLHFKKKCFLKAMDSAEKAVKLSPNSLEFAYFYARLLFEFNLYDKVVQEGQRILAVKTPIDPAKDRWEQINDVFPTFEARIAETQKYIRLLVDECINILKYKSKEQISQKEKEEIHQKVENKRYLAILETIHEKAKLENVPEKTISEEVEFVQNQDGQSMESKNAYLTLEERRKKIKADVAAARVEQAIQQNSESLQENLKHVMKKEEKVRLLWNSMSVDDKHNLLKLDIHDLLAHFHSPKSYCAKVISEAICFAKDHNNWKFWICCSCDEKFSNSDLHYRHVVEKHIGRLSEELQLVLPSAVSREWQSMISNGPWKPVDAPAALPILEEQWGQLSSIQSKQYTTRNNMLDEKDSHTGDPINKSTLEPYSDECHVQHMKKESKVKECSDRLDFRSPCWPIADDSERELLLEKTRLLLEVLLKSDALAADHMNKVIQYTMKKLQILYPGLQLSGHGLNQTHICIRFLDASQLGRILDFLGELFQFSMKKYTGNKSEINKHLHRSILECDIREKFFLDGDLIFVDKQSLRGEGILAVYADVDASATLLPDWDKRDTGLRNSDDLLRWMFTDSSSEKQLKSWSCLENLRKHQGKELHQILQMNFHSLKNLCEEKYNQLNNKEALQAIWALLFSELRERKFSTKHSPQSFAKVLQKKLEELIELKRHNDVSKINKSMLNLIQDVLNNARSIDFRCEPTSTAVATDFLDLDFFEDDDLVMQNSFHKADTCIKEAIMTVGEHIDFELMKIDTLIMPTITERAKLVSRINPSAAGDYRAILLPLAKSYILEKLEELAEQEATEKSKVAKEENVIQIAPDAKKRVNKRGSQSKPMPNKSKNNMKMMTRNTMDCSEGNEQFLPEEGAEEEILLHGWSALDSHIVLKNTGALFDETLKLEEELARLEENLERQRQYENDAKKKHLAQKHKEGIAKTNLDTMSELQGERGVTEKTLVDTPTTTLRPGYPPSSQRNVCGRCKSREKLELTSNSHGNDPENTIISIHGCSRSWAAHLLTDRWEAVFRSYNDPSIDLLERPVIYSGDDA